MASPDLPVGPPSPRMPLNDGFVPVFYYRYSPCQCNPWPCSSLQLACKIIAYVELIVSLGNLVGIGILVYAGAIISSFPCIWTSNLRHFLFVPTIVLIGLFHLLNLIPTLFLFCGAYQWSRCKCWVYFIISSFLHVVGFIVFFIFAMKEIEIIGMFLIAAVASPTIIFNMISIYFLYVVSGFIQYIKWLKYRPVVQPLVPDQQPVEALEQGDVVV